MRLLANLLPHQYTTGPRGTPLSSLRFSFSSASLSSSPTIALRQRAFGSCRERRPHAPAYVHIRALYDIQAELDDLNSTALSEHSLTAIVQYQVGDLVAPSQSTLPIHSHQVRLEWPPTPPQLHNSSNTPTYHHHSSIASND